MADRHLIIVGGGLAGLSAGCYALRSGMRTTIVEHNLALGGVCTSWSRGPYTVDGCIQWLMGGPFAKLYEELEILPRVELRTLETWLTYRDARDGFEVAFTRDIDALLDKLRRVSSADAAELQRWRRGVAEVAQLAPSLGAPELRSPREGLSALWDMRGAVSSLLHFRKPIGVYAEEHLASRSLRDMLKLIMPETAPAFVLLMLLGCLQRGELSRPRGGTAAFRDTLEDTYRRLGGAVMLHSTVDEVLIRSDRATGVRLADGSMLDGDIVLSSSSTPETLLRLLGGRYERHAIQKHLAERRMFDPIVLASFGVAEPYTGTSGLYTIAGLSDFDVGGRVVDFMQLRVCNDDPCFAPAGHSVIQAMLPTRYDWWATRGTRYGREKEALAERLLAKLEPQFPGLRPALRMVDVATPLTYWNMARSWRGAYEGWLPTSEAFTRPLGKKLSGLGGFYMAGQWVEPGGGVPMAVMSGRQAVQLMCNDEGVAFVASAEGVANTGKNVA